MSNLCILFQNMLIFTSFSIIHPCSLSLYIYIYEKKKIYMRTIFSSRSNWWIENHIVKIRWHCAHMCCTVYLLCPSFASGRNRQFWARSEHVNMHGIIQSSVKCKVRAVIRWLLNVNEGNSEQTKRNVVIRHCPSS